MKAKVNATRMELLRLRRRSQLARRGHKLLKDKLDGLIQRFLGLKKDYLILFQELEPLLASSFKKSVLASALMHPEAMQNAAAFTTARLLIEPSVVNIMGVRIPNYKLQTSGSPNYGYAFTSSELDEALDLFSKALPDLLKLGALSKSLRLVSKEITEVRRRVNALEYVLIPELEQSIRTIVMKLSEMERDRQVTLLKIKDIVRAH